MHDCASAAGKATGTLADGTIRTSLAAERVGDSAGPLRLPEGTACAPLSAAEAEFRATVWKVAEEVAARLGAIDAVAAAAPLLETRDGAPYPTVADIVRGGDHLEHFHTHRAVRKSSRRPSRHRGNVCSPIDLHTGTARKARH